MESEKMKEIKKALECCKNCDCGNCPYCSYGDCESDLREDMETLINELESENETIKFNMQETEKASFNINQMNGNLVLENQKLKDRIAELEKERKEHGKNKFVRGWKLGTEEFAERLKEKMIRRQEFIGGLAIDDIKYINVKDIDETLNEFINKGDDKR